MYPEPLRTNVARANRLADPKYSWIRLLYGTPETRTGSDLYLARRSFPAAQNALNLLPLCPLLLQNRRNGQEGKEGEEGPRRGEDGRQDGEEGVQAFAEGGGEWSPEGWAMEGGRGAAWDCGQETGSRSCASGLWVTGLRQAQRPQASPSISDPSAALGLLVYPVPLALPWKSRSVPFGAACFPYCR